MDVTLVGIFLEGLLSFLSPCVLPLLPLYMSYLAGADKTVDEKGNVKYKTGKVFISTVFFVLGICLTLALLAVSVNLIKQFLNDYSDIISIICGTILIIFGLHETGLIHINVLDSDSRFKVNLHLDQMNFLKAFLLGFIFSLGWSPCIGPMLANALMLAATQAKGYLYIVAYGLGLVIPFLITGLLTSSILNFLNSKKNIMKWVLKVAGIIMICFGIFMIYNSSKNIVGSKQTTDSTGSVLLNDYYDQNNNKINLNDYKGKYVILNFTTTWCSYCKQEIPNYLDFSKTTDEVVCLYVMSPGSSGVSKEEVIKYAKENYELTTIIDENDSLVSYFGVSGYPMKFVISPDGEVLGYTAGALDVGSFATLIEYAKQAYNNNAN